MAYYRAANYRRRDGLVSIFERFNHGEAVRFARELGVLREYVRGDADVLRDIARGWGTYEVLFAPAPD